TPSKAKSRSSEKKSPTYQDALDESLKDTFPASDPIAPGVAEHAGARTSSDKNPTDWKIEPGSKHAPPADRKDDLAEIYRALQRGVGRELVNDKNVEALIEMAMQYRDAQLELLLREWRSTCGDDPNMPKA